MNGTSYHAGEGNPPFEYPESWLPKPPPKDTMTVTAALCWWNESPADLTRCIRGVANVADRLIALDGAYRRYPGATVRSDPKQADAIRAACKRFGLDCLILEPDRLWAGQIEKRSHILAIAGVQSDWILTIDADHIITTERAAVREELRHSDSDIVDVPFHTPINRKRGMARSVVGEWHREQTEGVQMIPQLWLASLNLRVEQRHWWISGQKGSERVWAWAGDSSRRKLPHAAFVTPYHVEHRSLFRTDEQIMASRAFCNDRAKVVAKTGQEDDLPGLFPPEFDYLTIPT